MQDPHVVSLRYRLTTNETTTFENPPPVEREEPAFSLRLKDNIAIVAMKEHFGSEEQARREIDSWLRAWELDQALEHHGQSEIHFVFDSAEVVDRAPPPRGGPQVVTPKPIVVEVIAGVSAKADVTRIRYPEPPSRFRASQDVEVMWFRYQGYRDGKEPLAAMAYFCLTVVEARSGKKTKRREAAAERLNIDLAVLNKLGKLSSNVGDPRHARKFGGYRQALANREEQWLEETVLTLIRRLGEYDSDPAADLPRLRMAALPKL